ncbi:MAG: RNA polymerase sigma factor [Bacteroidia bacterium]
MKPTTFSAKVKEHASALKAYALYLTQNREDANDLLQETFLKAFSNYEKFTDNTNLKGWLYTIMKNTFINNYRRKVKRNTFLDSTDNDYYLNSPAHADSNGGEKKMAMDDIQHAISKLPFELREAFMMNFRGYKYQEIADHFGIPIGTVKTRIHLARQVLKKRLKLYGELYGMNAA